MSLLSIEDAVRRPPKSKVFIADTCFLIDALVNGSLSHELKRKLAENGSGLAYNVVVKKEVIHLVRIAMVEEAFSNGSIAVSTKMRTRWDNWEEKGLRGHEKLKEICNLGCAEMFREIFGPTGEILKRELEKVFEGCEYADTRSIKVNLSWDVAFQIMSTYGLDSSDAMIVNLAATDRTYSGIVTLDKDYRYCSDVEKARDFTVIMPRKQALWATNGKWKP